MFYYEGLSCPVCSKPFAEDDDIVVCPQCGLPHHRSCWKSIGKCFEDDKHGTNEQWSRERAQENVASVGNVCPHCKTENAEYAEFCNCCGYPLSVEDWHSAEQQSAPYVGEYTPFGQPYEAYTSAEKIGDSNAADLAAVVSHNTHYYMDRFRRIERGGSGGWNWAAFLISPFWLFYRKQFGLAVLYLVMQLFSNVTFAIMYAPVQFAESQAAAEAAMVKLMENPSAMIPVCLLSFIYFAMQILLGLRANHFYLQHCERKIAVAREKTPDLSALELNSIGGVTVGLAVLFYVISSFIMELVPFFFV